MQRGEGSRWDHVMSAISDTRILNPGAPHILAFDGEFGSGPTSAAISPPFTDAERAAIGGFLLSLVGKPYSIRACVWLALCRLLPPLKSLHDPLDDHSWVCSTSYTWAVFSAGPAAYAKLNLGDMAWDSVLPGDLARAFGVV